MLPAGSPRGLLAVFGFPNVKLVECALFQHIKLAINVELRSREEKGTMRQELSSFRMAENGKLDTQTVGTRKWSRGGWAKRALYLSPLGIGAQGTVHFCFAHGNAAKM
jgi:hypothetical protein